VKLIYKDFQYLIEKCYDLPKDTLVGRSQKEKVMIPKHIYRYFLVQTCKISGITQQWCADYCNIDRGGSLRESSKLVEYLVRDVKDPVFTQNFERIKSMWFATLNKHQEVDVIKLCKYISLF
jgi:hypothetical protein